MQPIPGTSLRPTNLQRFPSTRQCPSPQPPSCPSFVTSPGMVGYGTESLSGSGTLAWIQQHTLKHRYYTVYIRIPSGFSSLATGFKKWVSIVLQKWSVASLPLHRMYKSKFDQYIFFLKGRPTNPINLFWRTDQSYQSIREGSMREGWRAGRIVDCNTLCVSLHVHVALCVL